ncbi:MAG TPA: hypothetical protein VLJ38_22545 [Polyangiaceae bacterium]|nr:hypothetical protein [Polyangiaceae bacterium]
MRYRTGFVVLFAIAGAQACGGVAENDFSTPAGGKSAGGTGATGGAGSGRGGSGAATSSGGSKSSGGSSGSSGTGGSATGGSDSAGGTSGTGGDAAGGASGSAATGGTGADTTGGSAGMTGGTGGTGGSAGSGMNPDCAALEMDYSMTLQQAQACNPDSGKDQCTAMEKNDLTCPNCSVYVNPDNKAPIMHLAELRQQAGNHCVTPCPAIACVMPGSSTCAPVAGSRSAGRCTSQPLPL